MKKFILTIGSFALTGCASTLPMSGGVLDDHITTVSQCGVGNYTFPHSPVPCDRVPAIVRAAQMPMELPARLAEVSELLGDQITFELNSAELSTEGKMILEKVAAMIRERAELAGKMVIEGHTDHTGSALRNLVLSEARAEAVKNYLVSLGVPARQLVAKGFGESQPRFEPQSSTAEQTAKNRRVEFEVIQN